MFRRTSNYHPTPNTSAKKTPGAFRRWVRAHKKLSITLAVLVGLILIGGGIAAYAYLTRPHNDQPAAGIPEKKPAPVQKFYSPLTGNEVTDEAATTKPATAIMLENSPDARPQSGLKQAEVVYEAIAEGGITRFLAIYQQNKPQLVGPVRSLRMYYVDWLAPYDASVAHVGGSAAALQEIRNGSYRDIDQFFNPGSYWRATDRYAPHNVYTSFERLDALNAEKGYTSSAPKAMNRHDSTASATPTATALQVTISGETYNSAYSYDAATNTYLRSQGGAPHLDREEGQIAPRVVIVIKTPMTLVQEDGWRQHYNTTGTGSATIFQDGTVQDVTWHKDARTDQYRFTAADGTAIPLARGQTWITVVPDSTGGVVWQ